PARFPTGATHMQRSSSLIDSRPAMFEPLESRRMMSASLDANGNLMVQGSNGADNIQVIRYLQFVGFRAFARISVTENGVTTFDAAASRVRHIEVYGNDGNDTINVKAGTVGASVFGGGGSDTITTGAGNDFVAGDNQWVYPFPGSFGVWSEATGPAGNDYIDT